MDPIAAAAFAALDHRLDPAAAGPVALGLSGGGDSMALLLLASAWCAERGRPLVAFTVDHGLNPDSARWTRLAGEAATEAGAGWAALHWEGPKPSTGLPAAARQARHARLAEAARGSGAHVLLTGHTADDALEGELMRAADVPALGRLREWSPSPAWPEGRSLFLLRPLLGLRRAALRDWLTARGRSWIDDPANADIRFARPRARARVSGGYTPWPDTAEPAAPPRFRVAGDGRIVVARAELGGEGMRRFLAAAVVCAGGGATPPRSDALESLQARLAGHAPVDATLAGARIVADEAEVQLGREAGERFRGGLAPAPLSSHQPTIWDGRFELQPQAPGWSVEALGGSMARLSAQDRRRLKPIPAWARGALPALVGPSGDVRLPAPFGNGPAQALSLAGARLQAACGLVAREAEIGVPQYGVEPFVTLC